MGIQKTKKAILLYSLLCIMALLSISPAYAQLAGRGCCINPGAPTAVKCYSEILLEASLCCPNKEESPEYYNWPNGPKDQQECIQLFYKDRQACDGVSECQARGCCCSAIGSNVNVLEFQCKNPGTTFYGGVSSIQECNEKCAIPQCNDGIDNDRNGCADSLDTACATTSTKVESGGTCKTPPANCNNAAYTPKLSELIINPARGEQKLRLEWRDECSQNAKSYDVLRCRGSSCTNFALVATTSEAKFEDSSSDLLFDNVYTYQIKVHYAPQSATPTISKTASLGNIECLGITSNSPFCIQRATYEQYKSYLVSNFPNEFSGDFALKVVAKYREKFNKAFACDEINRLKGPQLACTPNQVCLPLKPTGQQPRCVNKEDCSINAKDPTGVFTTKQECEKYDDGNQKYCFYDRSYTIVNACFNCNPSMECYDYKTEGACNTDNCALRNCVWKPLPLIGQFGIGACVSTKDYNCKWCDRKGTETLKNLRSYNEIFDLCTKEKSDALSEGAFKCYYSNGKSASCNNLVCMDYDTSQCNNQVILDENNHVVSQSNDVCGIKVCENFGNGCAKNADGDDAPDCDSRECESDYFAPNTTITAGRNSKGIYDSLNIQVLDKISFNGSSFLRTSADYLTFLCVEPCNNLPYDSFTAGRSVIISNLNAFDATTGSRFLSFREGRNTIRYYSQDPSKNLGKVKIIPIDAYSNTAGPKVFSVDIIGSQKVLGKIYTSNPRPAISIRFFEPATMLSVKLSAKDKSKIIDLQSSPQLSTQSILQVPELLRDGEYLLEFNAKNEKNIMMDAVYAVAIVIDTAAPTITLIPENNAVINDSSKVQIRMSFNEEVILGSIILDGQDIKRIFNTTDNKIFSAAVNLSDGHKNLVAEAADYAGNSVTGRSLFTVDANPTTIKLVKPRNGAATSYSFEIAVETDNDAECRYSFDNEFNYASMARFTNTGSTLHNILNFNRIQPGDSRTHKLYVKCKDRRGISSNSFDLSVDSAKPKISQLTAFPNPISEEPFITTLTAETDKPSVCKYSTSQRIFSSMENKFDGFDDNNFREINRQEVTLQNRNSVSYFVACQSRSGLESDTKGVTVSVDVNAALKIMSHTGSLFNTTTAVISLETNKRAICTYSDAASSSTGNVMGPAAYLHRKELTLNVGKYSFNIECNSATGETASTSINFVIDTTAPAMLFVNDTSTLAMPDKTCNTDKLRVKFLAEDNESNVRSYFYSLFKGSQLLKDFVEIAAGIGNQWFWVENLNLEDNSRYTFSVKAKNFAGIESQPKASDGITVDISLCDTTLPCGNGRLDTNELCDPDAGTIVFGPINKCTSYSNFIGGRLGCNRNSCLPDTSNCISPAYCGDGKLDSGEHCDTKGNLFGAAKLCTDLGFASGQLACGQNCYLDTSQCKPRALCGNSIIDAGEECDGNNLGLPTTNCKEAYPNFFTGGSMRCNGCKLDTSSCSGASGACDGKFINPGESCDSPFYGVIDSCADLGFQGGNISCKNCGLDTAKCTPKPLCNNGLIDPSEECDGTNLGSLTTRCIDYSQYFESGAISCSSDCKLDTTSCRPSPTCGNGFIDPSEECDGNNFGKLNGICTNFSRSFTSGSLSCINCKLNTSGCATPNFCGDGVIDTALGETCDGNKFGLFSGTCINYSTSLISGDLLCSGCKINTTSCQAKTAKCGDGIKNQLNEDCDDPDLQGKTCQSFGYKSSSGNLKCTGCIYDISACIPDENKPRCGDSIVQKPNNADVNEQCDKANLDSKTCTSFDAYNGGDLGCRSDCTFDYSKCTPINPPTCQDGTINQNIEECDKTDLKGNTCKSLGYLSGELKCTTSCIYDTSACIPDENKPRCGDSIVQKPNNADVNEQCDKANLDGKTCSMFDSYTAGQIACKGDCTFNYADCTTTPRCGDGAINAGEQCDGSNLDSKNCKSFNYAGGTLKCKSTDCQFDFSQCDQPSPCGNAKIDSGELCDDKGPVFGDTINTCTFFPNYIGGDLGCSGCKLDKTKCTEQPHCGDKVINTGEHCDTNVFGLISSCSDLNFSSGAVGCTPGCFLDTSKCVPKQKCGNGIIDPGEQCDGTNLGPLNGQCQQYSSETFSGGTLKCDSSCKLDTGTCFGGAGSCGNNIINVGETCDNDKFGSIQDCKDYSSFSSGQLKCKNCAIDTSSCNPIDKCGNGLIDPSEECDGNNFGALNKSCSAYSVFFRTGEIACTSSCKLDTQSCQEAEKCGNGLIDAGEECDGNNFGNLSTSCTSYSSNFISGTLNCRNCRIRTQNCATNSTGVNCRDRGECELNSACSTNSDCRSKFCHNNLCKEPTCGDGIKNQLEPDVDCGGQCSAKCQIDKKCTQNSDCASFYCSLGYCQVPETCSDGKLSSSESDIDCGGLCPEKCLEGKACIRNNDCDSDLKCVSSTCKTCADNDVNCNGIPDSEEAAGAKDTDGDGIPDDWELEHGLNPNDPSDADSDTDGDGLTNREEYDAQSTYGQSTDPNLLDTDGDGFSDKEEIDKGTNPVDAKDFPKSSKLKIILLILGILILASGFGYLGYRAISSRKEEDFGFRIGQEQKITPAQRPQLRPAITGLPKLPLKKKEEKEGQKYFERRRIFEPFKKEEKPESKEIKIKPEAKPGAKAARKETKKPREHARIRKPRLKKPREDVFIRLKEIAAERKKGKKKSKQYDK
ncbi:hypothetical protein HYS31_00550 [Candidatus Woesearchaeota archaeon]|nr:hypothetical protein [Candidatus Woesearchaeota archaeon]